MNATVSDKFERHTWLWWAVWATLGSVLGGGYFLSRPWWFGHPVPLSVWGGEVAAIALGTLAIWWLAWQQRRGGVAAVQRAARRPLWLWGWGWLTWLSLGLALTPSAFWEGNFRAAVLWQHGLLLWFWLVWVGGSAWFLGWKQQGVFHRPAFTGWKTFTAILALWGAAALFIILTGWGWRASFYWQGVGVPILSGQVWLLLTFLGLGITVARWMPSRFWKRVKARDAIVVAVLWLTAFGIWWRTTPAPTHFQPAAFPPNYQRYPFSDAERYGLAGEQAVLGYGYFASASAPRGALVNTHLGLAGLLALIQVWARRASAITTVLLLLLAWTPALLYLLGALVHSRAAGLLLAGFEILHERNAILHADLFHVTSHVHMWATEPLLRETFVLLTLAAVLFLQRPWKRKAWLFAVGALLAFGLLVRREVLVLTALSPLLVFPILFSGGRQRQRIIRAIALMGILVAGIAAVLVPWVGRGHILSLRPPGARPKISTVSIIRGWLLGPVNTVLSPKFRMDVFQNVAAGPPSSVPSPSSGTTLIVPSTLPAATPSKTSASLSTTATPEPVPTATATAQATPLPRHTALATQTASTSSSGPTSTGFWERLAQWHEGLLVAIGDLFIRNILALVLAFPPVARFYPMTWVVGEKVPLWRDFLSSPWYRLPAETTLLLLLQIGVLSAGMAALWRKRREAVVFPLGLMVSYLGVSAVARDAGGRYIVPLDWVLPLFAAVGGVVLLCEGAAMLGGTLPAWLQTPLDLAENTPRLARRGWQLGGGVALLSLAMVVLEFGAMGWVAYSGQAGASTWPATTPPRWRPTTSDEILRRLDMLHAWSSLPWSREEVQQALVQHKVWGSWGYLFYPRYVQPTDDCGGPCWPGGIESPSLLFAGVLGGTGQMRFRLPLATPPPAIQDGSEVLVLFCKPLRDHGFIHAKAQVLIQIERGGKAPLAGSVRVFVPAEATLACPQP